MAVAACVLALALSYAGLAGQSWPVQGPWRFATDSKNVGLQKGFHKKDFDDSGWKLLEAGKAWEDQGLAGYDGWAWYRKRIKIPAGALSQKLVIP